MKERGILFSGEMVRAIIDGRKTQTRRVVKPQPPATSHPFFVMCSTDLAREGGYVWRQTMDHTSPESMFARCPYGARGDRLWVRETHCLVPAYRNAAHGRWSVWSGLPVTLHPTEDEAAYFREGFDRSFSGRWRPSIHMPRWASRILLEVASVRVERLNDISEADAIAEGCASVAEYRELWERINGAGSWGANPWVWVVGFRRGET